MFSRTPKEDPLIDSIGAILRALGQYAFDLETLDHEAIKAVFERWAEHATVGRALPGPLPKKPPGTDLASRDWAGLREFVVAHRKSEQSFVNRTQRDYRQVIRACVESMGRAISEEAQSDSEVTAQLGALSAALESNRIEDIKRVAHATIAAVDGASVQRRARQLDAQNLRTQLSNMGAELESAKREGGIDGLTTVSNRKAFDEHIRQTIEFAPVLDETVCLMMVDIDHFKQVNDTFGHIGGDAVLRAAARMIIRTFKRKRDFVARYGGEEFAVVMRDVTLRDAETLANRLLQSFRETPVPFEDRSISVTASAGLSMMGPRETVLEWVDRADRALYQAKREGRDRVVVGGEAPKSASH